MRNLTASMFALSLAAASCEGLAAAGREENIRVRATPYAPAPIRSGPYLSGKALPERKVDGGVEIAGHTIKQAHYDLLKRSGYLPMRRELADEELLAALKPEHRERIRTPANLAAHARRKFADYVPFLYWGFQDTRSGGPGWKAQSSYETHFTPQGDFRPAYLGYSAPPAVSMMRWAGSYWHTRDPKWARAVRDAFMPYYHANRPPANKIRNAKARGMWHPLSAGSSVPMLIEAYAYVHDSPDWSDRDHSDFWKAMLERGRFLRYTTVPSEPWPGFNPFLYGNIMLYQLEGLLAIAAHFPEFAEADEWLAHATRGIGLHGDWCVMPDSGFDEYSYSYAAQVAGQMEYCYNTLVSRRLPVPPRLRTNVLRLHELFLCIATPGHNRVPFGDTHRGGDMGVSRSRWAALAFLDARFKHFAGDVDEAYVRAGARVLHPEDPDAAAARYHALRAQPPRQTSHILPEPGWAIMRSSWQPGATVVAMSYRASDRVFHAGWEMTGFNLWANGEPLMTKLLGLKSYTAGYPDGYCRTPRQANQVVVKGAKLRRVAGSLRNWFSSDVLDYIHVDHRGWRDGAITARRRLLFIKPSFVLIIDDIEGEGHADLAWQAHTDGTKPTAEDWAAHVVGARGLAKIAGCFESFRVHELPVAGANTAVYMLSHEKHGELPIQFAFLIHVGPGDVHLASAGARDRWAGLTFGVPGQGEHRVIWNQTNSPAGRFLVWSERRSQGVFVASDGNPSTAVDRLIEEHGISAEWNGRVAFRHARNSSAPCVRQESLGPAAVEGFTYHGRPEMTPVGAAGRVSWRAERPAIHSVLYRPVGSNRWMRQLQPGLHELAWILIPDLAPGQEYELRVVSEFPWGGLATSPVFRRKAPDEWQAF